MAIYLSSCALAEATEPLAAGVNPNLPPRLRALWDLTEVNQTPLAPEIVEEREVDGFTVRGIYFTSEQTAHGPNRIYCGYARPTDADKRPPLIVVHGGGGHGSIETALATSKLLRVPVISMDWSGEASAGEYATQFAEPTPSTAAVNGKGSYAWHIVVAIRRTIDYLATLPEVDLSRVVVLGGSWGSYYSHLATATDPRITDFIGNSGAGGWDDSYSILAAGMQRLPADEREEFLATLDPIAYAPYCNARISMLAPTNDEFFWFGGLVRHYQAYPKSADKRLIPHINSNHGVGGFAPAVSTNPVPVPLLRYHLFDERPFPRVNGELVVDSDSQLYCWRVTGGEATPQHSTLYWSPGDVPWRSRYWVPVSARQVDGEWQARLPEQYADLCGAAMAVVFDGENRAVATPPIRVPGHVEPKLTPVTPWSERSIWDESQGALAWRATTTLDADVLIRDSEGGGITVEPTGEARRFSILTNSAVLASGAAKDHQGLKLLVDGCGERGELSLSLRLDTGREDFVTSSVTAEFGTGPTKLSIPWGQFSAPSNSNSAVWPFDTLVISGDRSPGKRVLIKSISFY